MRKSFRTRRWIAFASLCCVTSAVNATRADSLVTPADSAAAKSLFDAIFDGKQPPFSFNYDGKPIAAQLEQWSPKVEEKKLDDQRTQRTITCKDPATGLTVRMVSVRYADFPAAEWTVYLKNDGAAESKLIENFRGIDAVVGNAPATPADHPRATWSPAKTFPTAASGGDFEMLRGWVGNWRPMTKDDSAEGKGRFAVAGHAPWISRSPNGDGILMMPAQGIEGATDAPESGKSPGVAFVVPKSGIYHLAGSVADIGPGGDGVEYILQDSTGRILSSATIDDGKSASFDQRLYYNKGDRIGVTMHSRGTADGDLCRVKFDVTQLTDVVGGDVVLHTHKGADARPTDYQPMDIGVGANESVALASYGGRPSDAATLPYFNIQMPGTSAILAIGWPGQWDATFSRQDADVRIAAGQEGVKLVLKPGEEIRSPLIALLPYTGDDVQRGQNLWRRWMIAHNMPRIDGKVIPPILNGNSSHQFAEMIKANEANQNLYIDRYLEEKIKIDYWWMDAGWYTNDGTWVNTGTWKVDRNRFPNGLKGIIDHGRSKGVKSIVWFEPERVTHNSELFDQHPDFLLTGVQDLSNPTAGLVVRRVPSGSEPCIAYNATDRDRIGGPIHWAPKTMTLHPGPQGEYAVVRFTVPADGDYKVAAQYAPADPSATTDVHVLHGNAAVFDSGIQIDGKPALAKYDGTVSAKKGETIDFAVGRGNGHFESDMTSLAASLVGPKGEKFEAAGDFKIELNPNGPWSYGTFAAGDVPVAASFAIMNVIDVGGDPNGWRLLNLGNPQAWKWITDRVDSIIKSEGIDIYRQDFNIEPLNYWRSGDGPNRQGITENLYVQGYLAYWDALRERNPKIWIDSCASGGRRNDLETMRRAVPFIRSDYLFEPIGQQGHAYGVQQWLPYSGNGLLVGKSEIAAEVTPGIDAYAFRSTMAPAFTLAVKVEDKTLDYDALRKLIGQYHEISADYSGDYYPLTPSSLDPEKWIGWQFDVPEKGEGFVQAFRRPGAAEASMKLKLRGIDRAAKYDVIDEDHPDAKKSMTGAQLLDDGLDVAIEAKPGAALIRYHKQ